MLAAHLCSEDIVLAREGFQLVETSLLATQPRHQAVSVDNLRLNHLDPLHQLHFSLNATSGSGASEAAVASQLRLRAPLIPGRLGHRALRIASPASPPPPWSGEPDACTGRHGPSSRADLLADAGACHGIRCRARHGSRHWRPRDDSFRERRLHRRCGEPRRLGRGHAATGCWRPSSAWPGRRHGRMLLLLRRCRRPGAERQNASRSHRAAGSIVPPLGARYQSPRRCRPQLLLLAPAT
mmetsp:Transcript_68055/g.152944  ORF Transcript_68055/g.152944 Transcript_68055/m.152944 type:complete len:239 (-) Transcript_68055:380-1096(-)